MQDLISYLAERHNRSLLDSGIPGPDDRLPGFLAFAREHLKGNPPVAVRYDLGGMALALQDGTTVSLLAEGPPSRPGRPDSSVPVTRGRSGGMDATPMDRSGPHFPVTGG